MSFHRWCLVIAALVYFTAAWFGVGYASEDEFLHVILPAEHLCGHVDAASLPLDYHAHWRSMVQPLICAGVFKVCGIVGISDPFLLTFVLRLLTAALALWVINGFVRSRERSMPEDARGWFILVSFFLWFVPIIGIRFTGEGWSGLLILRGLTVLLDEQRSKRFMFAGLWFGAAVIFRPAAAVLPFGVLLWLVFVERARSRDVIQLVFAGAVILILGFVIDSLVYGAPTVTLWNYLRAGLGGTEAWRFTELPWHYHVLFIFKYATPPIALVLFAAFVVLLFLRPKHILVWTLVPFLLLHSALPVKELRFLFPLAPLMPWLLINAWELVRDRSPAVMARTIWLRLLLLLVLVNALALFIAMFTPAGNGRIELARGIHDRYGDSAVHIDVLGDWPEWIPPFYLAPGSTERFTDKIIADPAANGPIHLVIARESMDLGRIGNLQPLARATPAWTDRVIAAYRLEDEHDPLVLYAVTTQQTGH